VDNAVALVQAYLRVNGYFTVAEFPVIEAVRSGGYQTLTDIDVLAVRFPGAGYLVPAVPGSPHPPETFAVDPAIEAEPDRVDMLIGEVKEGKAALNEPARDPTVLRTVLARFGCCPPSEAYEAARELIRRGSLRMPSGHQARIATFGATAGPPPTGVALSLSLGHITEFLRHHIREHWPVVSQAQFKDPALSWLVTLEKATRNAKSAT